MAKLEFRKK